MPRLSFRLIMLLLVTTVVEAQKTTKCGMPDNFRSLPDYAQAELRDLWNAWTVGTDCQKELLIQDDILSVVDDIDKEDKRTSKATVINTSDQFGSDNFATSNIENIDDGSNNGGIELLSSSTNNRQLRKQKPPPPTRPSSSNFGNSDDYIDETTVDDVAMMQFDSVQAPFLQSASPKVKREFERVWRNDDIPSEGLRSLKIQTLAVSLLNAKQLEQYNLWATKRRRVLKAREQEIRHLSKAAKRALRKMSRARDESVAIAPAVKKELRDFVEEINRRRSRKLLLLH